MTAIQVQNLKKEFSISVVERKPLAKLKRYFKPKYQLFNAVDDVSFTVNSGEKIAFIGPNGAGKSTTIKLLTGIFQPTSGNIKILGLDPYVDRQKVAYKIGTVFGQRSQLWYHLPAYYSFRLLATIYAIDHNVFKSRLEYLSSLFHLERFMNRPIKELSLGERMRCELVASLIHHPEILFLDEPTIGLDIISKSAIREFIHQRALVDSTTIFLTSHDIFDIERVCDRIILINNGKIIVDDSVRNIKKHHLKFKHITVKINEKLDWSPHPAFNLILQSDTLHKFEVNLNLIDPQDAVYYLAKNYRFTDITIEDSPLEDIIKGIYLS